MRKAILILLAMVAVASADPWAARLGEWVALQQRRAVGELWTPEDLTGLALWLDAADSSTLWADTNATASATNNGRVARWDDKSENALNATQGTDNLRPTYRNDALGGYPSLDWGSTQTSLRRLFAAKSDSNWRETFVVAHWTADTENFPHYNGLFSGSDSTGTASGQGLLGNRFSVGGVLNWFTVGTWGTTNIFMNTVATVTAFPTIKTPFIVQYKSTSDISVNGYAIGNDRTNTGRSWQGLVSEVISVSAAVSVADKQRMEGYLAHKWGLAANLPSNHPYKNSPPTK